MNAAQRFIQQRHPLFIAWVETWRLLAEVYEGDGGFLSGNHLIPHPRELEYPRLSDGRVDMTATPVEKDKLKRRRQIARYENFAQYLIDLFVEHQYRKDISRTFEKGIVTSKSENYADQPIVKWWNDVDGLGTNIDDWLRQVQKMAHVFGHVFVVMDREAPDTPPQSAADESPLYLRVYTPLDALDWLAPHRKLTAVKFVEAVERTSLSVPSMFAAGVASSTILSDAAVTGNPNVQYRVWTTDRWTTYDTQGGKSGGGAHRYGELPVLVFYSGRRPRIPIIGRSMLGDGMLFKDHYNITSELRELMRSQTFSMLHVALGQDEEVSAARERLGDHAGVDSVVFSRGQAGYIAPPDGPARILIDELNRCEHKMLALFGLANNNTNSNVAETEGSRRLKAMDLNRMLGGSALEAQRFEYALARLWYIGTYGRPVGLQKYDQAGLTINHPDEFYVEQLMQTVEDVLSQLELPMGPTFKRIVRQRAVPKLLPDVSGDDLGTINQEISELADREAAQAQSAALAAAAALQQVKQDEAGLPKPPAEPGAAPQPGAAQPAGGAAKPKRKRTPPARPKSGPQPAAGAGATSAGAQ